MSKFLSNIVAGTAPGSTFLGTRASRSAPSAATVARATGAGRVAIGVIFLAAPVASVRILGVDSASAKRMAFLARMAAARDIGLGAGALAAGAGAAPWLAAAALADAVDAVAIAGALRRGTARGVVAAGIAAGAATGAALGIWAAIELKRAS